jgi:hypothetical protein
MSFVRQPFTVFFQKSTNNPSGRKENPGYSLSLYGGTYVLQDTPLFSELFS